MGFHYILNPPRIMYIGLVSKKCISFFEIRLANSVDPDEMPHYMTFHLGLYCLYQFGGFWSSKG